MNGNGAFLSVSGLKVWFPVARNGLFEPQRWVRAVDGVDLSVAKGKTLGLVGESGSGKTTVGRAILRLIPSTAGSVVFDGRELLGDSDAGYLADGLHPDGDGYEMIGRRAAQLVLPKLLEGAGTGDRRLKV